MTVVEPGRPLRSTMDALNQHPANSPASGRELLERRIEQARPRLSRKQLSLARYLLAESGAIAFATAAEVGAATGVSAASAVRFAQTLGYSGFTELRDSLRDGLRSFPPFAQQLEDLLHRPAASADEHAKSVLGQAHQTLLETAEMVDAASLTAVAAALTRADRIVLVGMGTSTSVLELLLFHFQRLGLPVIRPRDTVEVATLSSSLTSRDLVFGCTYWRFLRSTSDWLRAAQQRGAATVAITDSRVFPAQDHVDHVILVGSRGVGHGPSVVGSVAVVDALVSLLIAGDPKRFLSAIEAVERSYTDGHLLLE
jgi:DNA-binding MurR/RpiR family transcriptional regulator